MKGEGAKNFLLPHTPKKIFCARAVRFVPPPEGRRFWQRRGGFAALPLLLISFSDLSFASWIYGLNLVR